MFMLYWGIWDIIHCSNEIEFTNVVIVIIVSYCIEVITEHQNSGHWFHRIVMNCTREHLFLNKLDV